MPSSSPLTEDFPATIRTIGYTIFGLLILMITCPVLWTILRYTLLASVLGSNALTGLAVFITGGKRTLSALITGQCNENSTGLNGPPIVYVPRTHCFISDPQIVALVFLNAMNGVGLLLESVDRLLAMLAPLLYFRKSMELAIAMIAVSHCFVLLTVFSASIATIAGPVQNISAICRQEDLMGQNFYVFFAAMRTASAGASVILIGVVLVLLKRNLHRPFLARISAKRSFKKFLSVQTRYSHTLVISSVFTLLLFVLPTAYDLITRLHGNRGRQSLYSLILSYLNGVNMAAVIVYRHKDIRNRLRHPCGHEKPPKPPTGPRTISPHGTQLDNNNKDNSHQYRSRTDLLFGRSRSYEIRSKFGKILHATQSHRDLCNIPNDAALIWRNAPNSVVLTEHSAQI